MTPATTRLFLYGSLKRGRCNHGLVAGQEYLGDAVSAPSYRIIDLGRYPGLIGCARGGLRVRGELWRVDRDKLAELDGFEESEGLWKRGPIAVAGHEGVEAYFWIGVVPDGVPSGDEWPLGQSPSTSAMV